MEEHPLQYLHVGGDVQGVSLEQLVQLFFKALHDLIHHAFNALHSGGNVFTGHLLVLQLGIGPEDLQRSGEVIAQKAVQLGRFLRVLPLVVQNFGGDDADAVDLLAEPGVIDGVVDSANLIQYRVLGTLLFGLFPAA